MKTTAGDPRGSDPPDGRGSPRLADVVAGIARSVPELARWWAAYVMSDEYRPDEPFTSMTNLAREVVRLRSDLPKASLGPVFSELESRLADAAGAERYLLIVGFVEDLQTASLNADVALQDWEELLGEQSLEAWSKVDELWAGRLPPLAFNQYVDHVD